ncbi:MAG: hypothetical protein QOI15_2020 [Pseudonocardiales bacterium]|nr:hypothetical protein [Pseudonocardiales bacterium]
MPGAVDSGGGFVSDDKIRDASRRQFLGWSGVAAGGAVFLGALGAAGDDPELLEALAARMGPDVIPDLFGFTVTVRRPEDQLLLRLTFSNCVIDFGNNPPTITKASQLLDSFLTVQFGTNDRPTPMHVAEQAFTLSDSALPDQPGAPVLPGSGTSVDPPPVGSRIAGGTQLAFVIPDNLINNPDHPFTFTKENFLTWLGMVLNVVPNAVPPFGILNPPNGIGAPRAPGLVETAIELPYNLVISPPVTYQLGLLDSRLKTVFVNSVDPVQHENGWTELWHTRLAANVFKTSGEFQFIGPDETRRDLLTVRAIWCTDDEFENDLNTNKSSRGDNNDPAFDEKALEYGDRYDIVRLSSDFTTDHNGGPYLRGPSPTNPHASHAPFIPSPAKVDRLMLTSLGAWLECDAHWDLAHYKKVAHDGKPSTGYSSSLLAWRQRTVQARDTYVRIVRKGYLFPWGHKASLVTVTERQFAQKSGSVGAYLRQKTFIVVVEPVKNYTGNSSVRHAGRTMPFTDVEILTHTTPDLDQPKAWVQSIQGNAHAELVFQPTLGGPTHPYEFHLRGTDWNGDPIDFRSPVLWVDDNIAYNDSSVAIPGVNIPNLITKTFDNWNGARPNIGLHGQRVSMAKPRPADDPKGPAPTSMALGSFKLGADRPASGVTSGQLIDTSQPCFFPGLVSADVHLPEATALSGHDVSPSTMTYHGTYLSNEFDGSNPGGVFLKTAGTAHKLKFNSDKSGGSLTPNLSIDGYSRELGPASGDIDALAGGSYNPADVFAGVDAKLLGGIKLQDILSTVAFGDGDNAQALQLTSTERTDGDHRIVTMLDWHPPINIGGDTPDGGHIFIPIGDTDNSMDLHAVIVTNLDHSEKSTSIVTGEIRDFELHLFGDADTEFIVIPFDSLQFRSESGKKTDVTVDVSDSGVQFKGALEFVQELADALNFAGSGLTVDTAGDAITATLTLAIPSLSVGVFGLENLAFNAGVAIPYNGDPVRFDFAFCSRENPFQLEIMIFEGGGFVGLGIGADGVEMLEFSFDFGLGFSIDIGIASGEISLTGGVYFECEQLDDGSESVDLTAWVKASGGISALGIISISVELYLALEYQSSGGESSLAGDAELTISVHIIFFGFDVGFSVHQEFAGSSTPSFAARSKPAALAGLSPAAATDDPATNLLTSMTEQEWARYCTSFALVGVVGT